MIRIFDRNNDGYINKKEFKMMTTASKFSMKKIETVFAVSLKVYHLFYEYEYHLGKPSKKKRQKKLNFFNFGGGVINFQNLTF